MNILLVHPKDKYELFSSKSVPPLWAAVLASLTPKQHNIDLISCAFEEFTEAKLDGYDLVGISATTTVAHSAYKIADMCRARGIKVVMGGLHASMLPQEAVAHVDSIVHGEAEYIWSTVLNDAENDDLKLHYQGPLAKEEDIAIPDYSIANKYKFFYYKCNRSHARLSKQLRVLLCYLFQWKKNPL